MNKKNVRIHTSGNDISLHGEYSIFLDDVRLPHNVFDYMRDTEYLTRKWVVVRNYKSFCAVIENEWKNYRKLPSVISFDHDLADEHYRIGAKDGFQSFDYSQVQEKTGLDCAIWFVDFCRINSFPCPTIKCHSLNPVGRENIIGLLFEFRLSCDNNNQ